MGASQWTTLVRQANWVRRQPLKTKAVFGAAGAAAVLLLLYVFVNDYRVIFFTAELSQAAGISFLIYKLIKDRTCAGLSLKSQELMAFFLVLKIYYSYTNFDVHTILIAATLITTLWVVYMMRVFLKSSYMVHEDNFPTHYLVIACAVMTLVVHPKSSDALINRLILAFGCYLETVAIMPQLRLMQNTKIVESLTAHYVFALGVTRFLSCARWILQVVDSRGTILLALGYGFWPGMVFLSAIVQTSLLVDFCYYYIKSFIEGHSVLRLPSDTV
ncbi:ER lumen protein-retaining receptor-like [Phalaenopsis equestris]|uniref:ER lumen protein-retaining receptor-like n=1 Tax=Phalaenopsis equestris TaxID=78828 RepID=UPI0009E61134|nr:ER lumen protein-retaining receptor-like [Phalaenopsis equestris]